MRPWSGDHAMGSGMVEAARERTGYRREETERTGYGRETEDGYRDTYREMRSLC